MGTTQILTKFSEYVQKVSTVPANLKKIRSVVTAISLLCSLAKNETEAGRGNSQNYNITADYLEGHTP